MSCVILTTGTRPVELARAVESVHSQHGDPVQVVVVGNGGSVDLPPGTVEVVELPENVGVPGGRNEGVRAARGDVVVFIDDDGWLPDRGTMDRLRGAFAADPGLGVVSFRIIDPETGRTERRHVPRLRAGDPERSSSVTTFLGGACAIRASVLAQCGEFPEHFMFGHEEIDFAWRVLERRYRIRYDAGVLMYHPGGSADERHSDYAYYNARNRVWLARRRLPLPLAVTYVGVWLVVTVLRTRRIATLRTWFRGLRAGLREPAGEAAKISWRTALRLTALGRPPVI